MLHQRLLHILVLFTCVVAYGLCYYPTSETLKLGDVTLRMPKNMPRKGDVAELFGRAKFMLKKYKQKVETLKHFIKDHPNPKKGEKIQYKKKINDLRRKMKRDIFTFKSKLVSSRNRNPADNLGMMDHLMAFYNDFLTLPSKINECILGRVYPTQKPQKPKEQDSTPSTSNESGGENQYEEDENPEGGEMDEYQD